MKINVKRVQYLDVDYNGTKSQLIGDIFKDVFGYEIYQNGIDFEYDKDNQILKIKADVSMHGSPLYETVKEIKDENLINIYFSLKKAYNSLKKYEETIKR